MFDLNDFDETLPGPWEWDLKRLAASFTIAARWIGLGKREDSEAAQACAETYRTTMAEFAGMSALDTWYASLTARYEHPGQRVVEGQRMIQAASDMFLGWSTSVIDGRHYYWRQLRDMKGSAEIEASDKSGLTAYARICGWSLARAHARSGEPVMIAGYLGKSDSFDRAIAEFARRYAEQNDSDFAAHAQAVADGLIPATFGV